VPHRNRVTPLGELIAVAERGAWTGNRGVIHAGTEIVRHHAHAHWLICALRFKDRRSELWRARRFTWLFFHDEAVALAAGHRPCAECRRASFDAFRDAWADGLGLAAPRAPDIDRRLHRERLVPHTRRRRLHDVRWGDLPAGSFVLDAGAPALLVAGALVPWTPAGYGDPRGRPRRATATAITPPATIAALRAGYPVQIDAAVPR
jgi:hypothetical protein